MRETQHRAAALDHLGWETGTGPTIWARAVRDQLALHESSRERFATSTADLESWERLHGSALMLVVAIHQVQAFERRVRRLAGSSSEVARARGRFDTVAPDAEKLRDIIAHLDAYTVAEGSRQTGERAPLLTDQYVNTFLHWSDGGGTILDLGGERMNLREAANAAMDLAEAVERHRAKSLVSATTEANEAVRLRYGISPSE